MSADPSNHRREALRRMSRRRKRRFKASANPGGEERSWAEYSGVTLTPSSDHKQLSRLVLPIVSLGLLAALVIVLSSSWTAFDLLRHQITTTTDTILAYSVTALLVACAVMSSIAMFFGMKRFIVDLFRHK